MRRSRPAFLFATLVALLLPVASAAPAGAADATKGGDVALVALASGTCTARATATAPAVPLRLLDRVRPGTRLETNPDGRLVIVFLTGERFEIGPGSSATVGPAGLGETRGTVSPLSPVSPHVTLTPLAAPAEVSRRAGAVRVRGEDRLAMYPSESAALVTKDAVLRFSPVPGAERYAIAVEDEAGNTVFSAQTAATQVALPPAILRDGSTYFWRVRARGPGLSGTGREERFVTLSADEQRTWEEARENLVPSDPSLGNLLAATAFSLGLRREACLAARAAGGASRGALDESLGCESLGPFLSPR
jgi:hypothetical protein